jgi:hypothetical protein
MAALNSLKDETPSRAKIESGGFCEVARQKQLLMPGQNGDLIEAGLNETAESGGNSYGDCVS